MFKKIFLLLILLIAFSTSAQKRRLLIKGKVLDSLGIIKNADIINLKTKQGTSSSDDGDFRIFVAVGDSLRISSVQYIAKTIAITKRQLSKKHISIKLKINTYKLKEFELKRNNLIGKLGIDTKTVPIDKRAFLLRKTMDLSKVDMKGIDNDYINQKVKPPINSVDPTDNFAGAGATVAISFKYSKKLWALRRKLEQKKEFPYKILSELGDDFFFKKLKIPIENYFHFLEYCNPLGIENLYKKGKLLEVIKILEKESVSYLKIINKKH